MVVIISIVSYCTILYLGLFHSISGITPHLPVVWKKPAAENISRYENLEHPPAMYRCVLFMGKGTVFHSAIVKTPNSVGPTCHPKNHGKTSVDESLSEPFFWSQLHTVWRPADTHRKKGLQGWRPICLILREFGSFWFDHLVGFFQYAMNTWKECECWWKKSG